VHILYIQFIYALPIGPRESRF